MAALAIEGQQKRTVQVSRAHLVEVLTKNREKHIADYQDAMAGWYSTKLGK